MSHDDDVHARPVGYYIMNFGALMFLLMITVWVSFYHFGDVTNVAIMLSIAIVKMTLVVMIFMDVWWSSKLTKVFAMTGFLWLIIMFALTFSDYVSRDKATGIGIAGDPNAVVVLQDLSAHNEVVAHEAAQAAHGAADHDETGHGHEETEPAAH